MQEKGVLVLGGNATKEAREQVESQDAHHEHGGGAIRNGVQIGHDAFAVDLPNMHGERFRRTKDIPRARRACEIETREIEHGRRLAGRIDKSRRLAENASGRQDDSRNDGGL